MSIHKSFKTHSAEPLSCSLWDHPLQSLLALLRFAEPASADIVSHGWVSLQDKNQGSPATKPRKKGHTRNPSIQKAKEEERTFNATCEETLSYTQKRKIRSFISPLGGRNVTVSLPWVWRMIFKRMFGNLIVWNEESTLPQADKSKEGPSPGDGNTTWTIINAWCGQSTKMSQDFASLFPTGIQETGVKTEIQF